MCCAPHQCSILSGSAKEEEENKNDGEEDDGATRKDWEEDPLKCCGCGEEIEPTGCHDCVHGHGKIHGICGRGVGPEGHGQHRDCRAAKAKADAELGMDEGKENEEKEKQNEDDGEEDDGATTDDADLGMGEDGGESDAAKEKGAKKTESKERSVA